MTADKDALLRAATTVKEMLELGDTRLMAGDGPCGGQLPQLSPDEWGKVYRACKKIIRITAALAEKNDGWIKCSERMPKAGDRVFVLYSNANGLHRKTIAHYAPKHTISAEHWEEAETDDTEDGIRWEPEGWWEDYAEAEYITPLPDPVTHWRPLPPLPKGE